MLKIGANAIIIALALRAFATLTSTLCVSQSCLLREEVKVPLHYSCFKIQKSKLNNLEESTRAFKAHYLLKNEHSQGIELSNSREEAKSLRDSIIDSATKNYISRTKQKPQFKRDDVLWSAVVLIKPETTMQDLQNLTEHFKKKYGWQNYHIAIHRDEGHIDPKTGNAKYNLHAHLEFVMLDQNGITSFKKGKFGKKTMSQIQTEVADILKMVRGQDKRETKEIGLDHKTYRQEIQKRSKLMRSFETCIQKSYIHIDDLKAEYISKKEVSEIIEKERKSWIEQGGFKKDDYAELRALKLKNYENTEDLQKEIEDLKEKIAQIQSENAEKSILEFKAMENIKNENKRLKNENEALKTENDELKTLKDTIIRGMSTLKAQSFKIYEFLVEHLDFPKIENPQNVQKKSQSRGFVRR